jgi:hypothetical protein
MLFSPIKPDLFPAAPAALAGCSSGICLAGPATRSLKGIPDLLSLSGFSRRDSGKSAA